MKIINHNDIGSIKFLFSHVIIKYYLQCICVLCAAYKRHCVGKYIFMLSLSLFNNKWPCQSMLFKVEGLLIVYYNSNFYLLFFFYPQTICFCCCLEYFFDYILIGWDKLYNNGNFELINNLAEFIFRIVESATILLFVLLYRIHVNVYTKKNFKNCCLDFVKKKKKSIYSNCRNIVCNNNKTFTFERERETITML